MQGYFSICKIVNGQAEHRPFIIHWHSHWVSYLSGVAKNVVTTRNNKPVSIASSAVSVRFIDDWANGKLSRKYC